MEEVIEEEVEKNEAEEAKGMLEEMLKEEEREKDH